MSDPEFEYRQAALSRTARFDKAHGDDAVEIDGWLFFSDGARRECSDYGIRLKPPTDPRELCGVQLEYHEARLHELVETFRDQRQRLLQITEIRKEHGAPPPPKSELKKLQDLKTEVEEQKKKVGDLRRRVQQFDPNRNADARALDAELAEMTDDFMSRVRDTRI
jgi:hypothetical protein